MNQVRLTIWHSFLTLIQVLFMNETGDQSARQVKGKGFLGRTQATSK